MLIFLPRASPELLKLSSGQRLSSNDARSTTRRFLRSLLSAETRHNKVGLISKCNIDIIGGWLHYAQNICSNVDNIYLEYLSIKRPTISKCWFLSNAEQQQNPHKTLEN
uniref:Uncharacterized protein n=1 Tax=Romanomermis culicivorax TaxID=13658 RepID=A0A915JF30_ROMCU